MKHLCPECGMVLNDLGVTRCPKCDCEVYARGRGDLMEIDVAHEGEDWPEAERKMLHAISRALLNRHKGLRVVHGHGSAEGHTSNLRPRVIAFLNEVARTRGYKVARDKRTEGVHILYF